MMELIMTAPIIKKKTHASLLDNLNLLKFRADGYYYENFGYTATTACCYCGGGICVDEW